MVVRFPKWEAAYSELGYPCDADNLARKRVNGYFFPINSSALPELITLAQFNDWCGAILIILSPFANISGCRCLLQACCKLLCQGGGFTSAASIRSLDLVSHHKDQKVLKCHSVNHGSTSAYTSVAKMASTVSRNSAIFSSTYYPSTSGYNGNLQHRWEDVVSIRPSNVSVGQRLCW